MTHDPDTTFGSAAAHDSIGAQLTAALAGAIAELTGRAAETADAAVRPAGDPKFGDYQCNAAMGLAKALGMKPREVAERIRALAEPRLAGMVEPLAIAGPGFINIRLTGEFLARHLREIPAPPELPPAGEPALAPGGGPAAWPIVDRVGIRPVAQPQRVVIDYSQPNIAKQMHVGHLRSTIIGDALARVLAFLGHDTIRQNHIGDWGTQFGMLIRWYREHPLPTPQSHADVLEAAEADYKAANERFEQDAEFAAEARRAVTALQGGDADARRVWEQIRTLSLAAVHELYDRLGVLLGPEDVCGESFYNPWLAETVAELRQRLKPGGDGGVLAGVRAEVRDDAGAVCVFMYKADGTPLFATREGNPLPMIIQKADGGYNYETTDLAGLRYRIRALGARRILYVVDMAQGPHFDMVFTAARAAGLIPAEVEVTHVKFGMVLGADGKRIKTRAGRSIKLRELLDEAEVRARTLLEERDRGIEASRDQGEVRGPTLTADEKQRIAPRVGIAAVKYADLRTDRNSNYVFDWDKMISLQGNTAPYMMYAYARIRSIYRKAAERYGAPEVYAADVALRIEHPAERALALRLARLPEAIEAVASELLPHILCGYLYDLAAEFMRFYESCPVLQAADEASRLSRMRLCDLTARTLRLGLALLGIEVIERM